jgi:hypothetical protein
MAHALLVVLALQSFAAPRDQPPVRIWLAGNPDRAYVQTATDGHLVLLHARTDGQVEVLFPADPASDPFVVAGTYEIPFSSSGSAGRGMVVAALSPDPIWFDEFVHRSMWDVAALTGAGAGADPEAVLTDVVQRMLGDGSFSYDVATYRVEAPAPTVFVLPPVPTVTVVPDPGVFEAGTCLGCFYPWVDAAILGLPYPRHFSHRRWNSHAAPSPWARTTYPDPPAIAAYAGHQPNVPAPLAMRRPELARPPRYVARSMPTSRGRTPTAAAPVPATFAVRAAPLVARTRSTTTAPTPAMRSQLLVRYVRAPRNECGDRPMNAPADGKRHGGRARVHGTKALDERSRTARCTGGSSRGAWHSSHGSPGGLAHARSGGRWGGSDRSGSGRTGHNSWYGRCPHRGMAPLVTSLTSVRTR